MRQWKSIIIVVGVVAIFSLLLSACSKSTTELVKPYRGNIQRSFAEQARTKLDKVYSLNMPLNGQLARIDLEPGAAVKAGQIVAYLEPLPLEQAVKKAQANLDVMKAYYNLQVVKVNRRTKLGEHGFISKSDLDTLHSEKDVYLARVAECEANLAVAEYNLNQSKIVSPITGVVLTRATEGGKWLQVGTPLLQVGSLDQLEVVSDVLTQDAQLLTVGDPVSLTSIGSTEILHGKVKRIDPEGFTKRSALGVDEQRVHVIISLDDAAKSVLGVGYQLQAQFLVGKENKNVLIVPRFSVLQDPQDNFYVFVVKGDKIYKQIVEVGLTTDEKIEITKGLTINDTIIAQPTADMHTDMKI